MNPLRVLVTCAAAVLASTATFQALPLCETYTYSATTSTSTDALDCNGGTGGVGGGGGGGGSTTHPATVPLVTDLGAGEVTIHTDFVNTTAALEGFDAVFTSAEEVTRFRPSDFKVRAFQDDVLVLEVTASQAFPAFKVLNLTAVETPAAAANGCVALGSWEVHHADVDPNQQDIAPPGDVLIRRTHVRHTQDGVHQSPADLDDVLLPGNPGVASRTEGVAMVASLAHVHLYYKVYDAGTLVIQSSKLLTRSAHAPCDAPS